MFLMFFLILFSTFSLIFMNSWISVFLVMVGIFLLSMINLNQMFDYSVFYLFSLSTMNNLMIFLSVMLCVLAIISTPDNKKSFFLVSISFLMFFLLMVFSVGNVMLFYIFFEATLIPTLMLVSYWGYQPERLQAGSYMMLYTVCASLPLLIILLYICIDQNNMMMIFPMKFYTNFLMILMVYLAFLVKLPMYSVHLWLPKAHVEASLAGSMLLAGILLKLGGYGLIKMNMLFDIGGSKSLILLAIISFSFWGGLLAAFMCLKQIDMKSFVAYSSVSHMSLVILGILCDSTWGLFSVLITMFAHGFCSSALFCMTYYTYTKFYSRSIMHISGIISIYPKMSLLWFIFCCANMAAPPSLNLLGEMFIAPVVYSMSGIFLVLMGFMVFVSGFYNMYLYTVMNHGSSSMYAIPSSPMKGYQMTAMLSHFLPMLLLVKMDLFY
uniref:NADH-ubiquinone oxidoreductase chain 4 n=1 Tax=Bathyomphalus contortus TaxID=419017 RepID=A0A7D6W4F9_9GAST|nr:NADH dehydrogenase subunit 4 [Bathyomphalus contortus]